MNEITTIIVDDEPPAREKLRILLARDPMFKVVQECANGQEAIQAVYAHSPKVVFIDVQMPDIDGFTALESIDPLARPLVVLTTAFSHYAVQAFEAEVLDYLLKPFDEERLARCTRRIKSRLMHRPNGGSAADRVEKSSDAIDRFLVKSEGRILFFEADEIDWIEAASNYVEIHSGSQSFLVRHTMNELKKPGIANEHELQPSAVDVASLLGEREHRRIHEQLLIAVRFRRAGHMQVRTLGHREHAVSVDGDVPHGG